MFVFLLLIFLIVLQIVSTNLSSYLLDKYENEIWHI